MLFEIAIIAHTAICLICIVLCAKARAAHRAASIEAACLYYLIWDVTGMETKEIIEEAIKAGQKRGLPVELRDEPFEVEGEEWNF